jgi:hypothetical protein
MKRFLLLSLMTGLLSGLSAQTATDTLWMDDFSDGNYTANPVWEIYPPATGSIVNGEFVLQGAPPYNDAWAWTLGDTNNSSLLGTHYGIYYSTRLEGTGTPASIINCKDNAVVYWIVNLYPANNAIYLMRGEYPAAALYTAQVTGLSKIQIGQTMKVLVQVLADTFKIKVWTGPFPPTSWDLEYVSGEDMGSLWPGIQIGGWWLDTANPIFDDFMVVTYEEVTAIDPAINQKPEDYWLSQNYPNPFNPTTSIDFNLPSSQEVKLIIYDLNGRTVRTLLNEKQGAGLHSVVWDSRDDAGNTMPSGVYFYQLTTGSYSTSKKLMLIK